MHPAGRPAARLFLRRLLAGRRTAALEECGREPAARRPARCGRRPHRDRPQGQPETHCRDTALPLRPEDGTVLFWTDGLLNRRDEGTVRPDRLLREAEKRGTRELADFLDRIAARLGGPSSDDDSYLPAARLRAGSRR
ncbi:hypothetical protein [Kitasatospora sp. NPDC006786]|uniref:hypothetical protein n=1 Tax=unclassified Kitasatospora TaxID=2633591 RepID=UPI0033F7D5E7